MQELLWGVKKNQPFYCNRMPEYSFPTNERKWEMQMPRDISAYQRIRGSLSPFWEMDNKYYKAQLQMCHAAGPSEAHSQLPVSPAAVRPTPVLLSNCASKHVQLACRHSKVHVVLSVLSFFFSLSLQAASIINTFTKLPQSIF